ncbi:hypothetical protein GGI07_004636 [Coemansia sp. Benny D115]|nr:hypothetical protein GGI07_004636 [Coemansia sp. Benny D115]
MDTHHIATDIDSITDIEVLRAFLRDSTQSLQAAAQAGLSLAKQNQELQQHLSELAQEQADLHQRLLLVERDRRWMQQQSLRVDQVRAGLSDLAAQTQLQGRRMVPEQRVDDMQGQLDKLRDEMDFVARIAEEYEKHPSSKRPGAETSALQRGLTEARDELGAVCARVADLDKWAQGVERQTRSQQVEWRSLVADVERRVAFLERSRFETGELIEGMAGRQNELERSLGSVIAEYNAMLGEQEQAIRILGDNHAVLESQIQVASAMGSFVPRTGNAGRMYSSDKAPDGRRPRVRMLPRDEESPMILRSTPVASSGASMGESLGDIFANDEKAMVYSEPPPPSSSSLANSLPSPPLSAMNSQRTTPPNVVNISGGRKAASVIGAPMDHQQRTVKPKMRARNSSFSKLTSTNVSASSSIQSGAVSPVRAVGFNNIISTTAHIGVGWGNYWQARRHRLQFDIQKRLALSASAATHVGQSESPGNNLPKVFDELEEVED